MYVYSPIDYFNIYKREEDNKETIHIQIQCTACLYTGMSRYNVSYTYLQVSSNRVWGDVNE